MGEIEGYWQRVVAPFGSATVDEVLVNGILSVTIVSGKHLDQAPSPFESNGAMLRWLLAFARQEGVRLDPLCGSAGGRVSLELCKVGAVGGGHLRWHALLPPLSQDGPLLALRRHRFGQLTLKDFGGAADVKNALFQAVVRRRPILIAGPTGSGKTTLLLALLAEAAANERIVIIESLAELPQLFPTWIRLLERLPSLEGVGHVSLDRLLREALRLRPDRIVLGEIRGEEAWTYLDAISSGHEGGLATIHAGSSAEARERLWTLAGRRSDVTHRETRTGDAPCGPRVDVVVLSRGDPPAIAHYDGEIP